jgi:RNA polymerase sigma factor (sigma-70 family)
MKSHRDPSDIEDTVQDVLLTVHSIRHTYDPARPFAPWLVAIAHRRIVDRLRRQGRSALHEVPLAPEHETLVATEANYLEEDVDSMAVREAVERLPPAQRDAVKLMKLQEMSLHQAVVASGMSIAALKVATHRGLKSLRKLLNGPGSRSSSRRAISLTRWWPMRSRCAAFGHLCCGRCCGCCCPGAACFHRRDGRLTTDGCAGCHRFVLSQSAWPIATLGIAAGARATRVDEHTRVRVLGELGQHRPRWHPTRRDGSVFRHGALDQPAVVAGHVRHAAPRGAAVEEHALADGELDRGRDERDGDVDFSQPGRDVMILIWNLGTATIIVALGRLLAPRLAAAGR